MRSLFIHRQNILNNQEAACMVIAWNAFIHHSRRTTIECLDMPTAMLAQSGVAEKDMPVKRSLALFKLALLSLD